ncbi:MAG: 2-oxo acid dehydrogenase subunit E2, partial [Chlorobi bacterium]|nr:2-oxo acid dehydrogenase subunit E2 [Chlorobiota bacterium]
MALYKLRLPHMGEGVIEATLTAWLKEVGDRIEEDEPVFEVATDKVDSEVPSEVPGILKEKLFKPGDAIKIGEVVAIIETDREIEEEDEDFTALFTESAEPAPQAEEGVTAAQASATAATVVEDKPVTPLARNIAKVEGLSHEELMAVPGTGEGGLITKRDVLNYLKARQQAPAPAEAAP